MANIKSQAKRNKQNEKQRKINAQVKSATRTTAKNVIKAVESKTVDQTAAQTAFHRFVVTIDKAASKGVIHKNTAARKKSRLAKKVNALAKPQA